ncbi:efflux transporter outer membrane subunit [Rubrivivax gelatinosus]|uniref:Multidrug efflux system outer membrane protein n=1 Tax=Rubrivivax gelatinosus TaxID=28068 RepID=A0A4R2MCZ7_RUBGE|nr:efflux transporter outer membrane subunit [Rubrivivax gelatinosus]MBK1689012.1 RND transporter [Rubrivivax gelatinosus]TCP03015.1 multidrug efflux system outer membrane protein [Rubrivivax gelatinosus]
MPDLRPLHPPGALAAVALAALLAGCTTGPDYRRPETELPARYAEAASAPQAAAHEALDTAWWSAFGDPNLDTLVHDVLANNPDLRIAAHRVEQLDAFLQVSRSEGLPQVGYEGQRTRDTLSENRQSPLNRGTEPVDNNYTVSGAIRWELDLWGKLRRADESAFANLMAGQEGRRALEMAMVAKAAAGYLRLLSLDRELELLQRSVKVEADALALAQSRWDNGGSSELPVLHARSQWQQRSAEIPAKEAEIAALENALGALAGRNPGALPRGSLQALKLPVVPAGLPADLLAQRPDVRQREQELISANARIGVAKAQFYPTIGLTSSSGFASSELGKLDQLTSNFGSFGLTFFGPIFTGGRLTGQVREAEALQRQAAIEFLKSVQTALHEVQDALVGRQKIETQMALRDENIAVLERQREVAQRRYDLGRDDYFQVLDAERSLASGLQLQNQTRYARADAFVSLYKALGGGWSLPAVTASTAQSTTTSR